MSAPGARWWRRDQDGNLEQARAAKGSAAMTLLELDTVQRAVEGQVQAYLDYSPAEARRFGQTWAPVQLEANAAITHYLDVVGAHDVDADLDPGQARAATQAFTAAGKRMHAAQVAVQHFADLSEPRFEQVRIAGSQFGHTMQEVDGLVLAAEQAVAAARTAQLRTVEPEAELDRARAALHTAREGVSVHGLRTANEAARTAAEHARAAAAAARGLDERAAEVRHRLASARTRLQVSVQRTDGTAAVLSELRKRFSSGASVDLVGAPEQVAEQLALAERAVARAAELATPAEQRWAEAEASLSEGRAAVVTAEGLADRVRTRLAELDAVIADPHGPLTATRRVVRDAQRFLLEQAPALESGSSALPSADPDARSARALDSLAERVLAAEHGLAERGTQRVDHWAWLSELTAVRAAAADVVAQVRERTQR